MAKRKKSKTEIEQYEHKDKDGRMFYGNLHLVGNTWATINIFPADVYGGETFKIDTVMKYPYTAINVFAPTIMAYERMAFNGHMPQYFGKGEMPQTFEQIDHKNDVFLAGWKSFLEHNGEFVRLEDVPLEWESPFRLPKYVNKDKTPKLFEKMFGK